LSYPSQNQIEKALLIEIAKSGGSGEPSKLYKPIANHFPMLTTEDLNQFRRDGLTNRFENMVRYARWGLVKKGWLDSSKRGVWKIAEESVKFTLNDSSLLISDERTGDSFYFSVP